MLSLLMFFEGFCRFVLVFECFRTFLKGFVMFLKGSEIVEGFLRFMKDFEGF